jgi:arabinofuranosyltransferase
MSRHTPTPKLAPVLGWLLVVLLLIGFGALVVRNAWLSDDAYITFRTVDNFVHGYGLTWNVAERVQVYTHPLWMLLLSGVYAITREITITSQILSILTSLAAVSLLLFARKRAPILAIVALMILSLSKAFVDYATSGLENPLTHLILAGFMLTYLHGQGRPRWLFELTLWAALGIMTRMDLALIFAPALVWALISVLSVGPNLRRRAIVRALGQMVAGVLPVVAWEVFSLAYYGSWVPNTALAKLNTGLIPAAELAVEGLRYCYNSLRVDPITLITIAVAALLTLSMRSERHLPLAIGCALYLLYIVRIGGDFMSGRFFTAPLFVAVGIFVTLPWGTWIGGYRTALAVGLVLVAIGGTAPYTPLRAPGGVRADVDPEVWVAGRGITDERANYYPATSLLTALRTTEPFPNHDWALQGRQARLEGPHVVVKGSVGLYGYYAGPEITVVDLLALGDPLLARLPVMDPEWKIGHYGRYLPEGYLATLEGGENVIADSDLARFYDRLSGVIRGELTWPVLLSRQRWREIWRLNTGAYEPWLAAYVYEQGSPFVQAMRITNPTDHPCVYVYLWNVGPGAVYLLDDASQRGAVYEVRWTLSESEPGFSGDYLAHISVGGTLSDAALLRLGAFFAPDTSLTGYEMFERRYWFRFAREGDRMQVLKPGPVWRNPAAPGGFWEQTDLVSVITFPP